MITVTVLPVILAYKLYKSWQEDQKLDKAYYNDDRPTTLIEVLTYKRSK